MKPAHVHAAAVAAYQAGSTLHEVAAECGASMTVVRNWLVAAGMPRRPPARRG